MESPRLTNGSEGNSDSQFNLAPEHLADLRDSGLTDETIRAAGLYSERNWVKVRNLLNRPTYWSATARSFGPCLVFPHHGLDGNPTGFCRVKPLHPRQRAKDDDDSDPDKIKYEQPLDTKTRPYLPPGLSDLAVRGAPRLNAEGEKKALAGVQARFAAISIPGIWNWGTADADRNKPRRLHQEILAILDRGVIPVIAFDYDEKYNGHVQHAQAALAEALQAAGSQAHILALPPGPNGAKSGLDDFLVRLAETGGDGPLVLCDI